MQDFKSLKVWEQSHALVLDLYKASAKFPSTEIYGLTSQLRRAAASIPANIAEGCGRGGAAEFARFLKIAAGSASELEYHLLLAYDLGLLSKEIHEDVDARIKAIKRMLATLIKKVLDGR